MATVYSGWSDTWKPSGSSVYKKYRAKLVYSTAETSTMFYVYATTYFELNSSVDVETANGKEWATGYSASTAKTSMTFGGATSKVVVSQKTYSWAKADAVQTKYVYGSVMSNKKDWNGYWMTATATITIPALVSYDVIYDENKPAGVVDSVANMPANQTKYEDISLSLADNTPVLTNYVFTGWDDGNGNTYQPGDAYTGNANVTLSAQWAKVFIPPFVSEIDLTRVGTSNSTTPDDEGSYLLVTLKDYISGDVPADGGSHYKQTTMSLVITKSGNTYTLSPLDSASFTGTGSEKNIHFAVPTSGYSPSYPTSESYPITLTFSTTGYPDATYETVLPSSIYPIAVESDASEIAFGIDTVIKQDLFLDLDVNNNVTDQALYTAIVALGWDSDVIV